MKKTLVIILLIILINCLYATDMVIEKVDGSFEIINMEDIARINFSSPETMIIQTVTGTVEFNINEVERIYFDDSSSSQEMEMVLSKMPFRFLKNSPNPFNPVTKISFELTEDTDVAEIEIFNIKGERIKTFKVNDPSIGSIQTVFWDGRDENNKRVSSNMYFYRLQVNGKYLAKKMILLK